MVVIDLELVNKDIVKNTLKGLNSLANSMSLTEQKKLAKSLTARAVSTSKTRPKTTSLSTDLSAFAPNNKVNLTDNVTAALLEKQGKTLATINTKGKKAAQILKEYTSSKNPLILQFPKVAPGKGIIIIPKTGDLEAVRVMGTKNAWTIKLKKSAVDRHRRHLVKNLAQTTEKHVEQEVKKIARGNIPNAVQFAIASKLSVPVDSIKLASISYIGTNITTEVQKEMSKRMHKRGKFYATDRGARATPKLVNRTGKFVESTTAKVTSKDVITYQFSHTYDIHEKRKGAITTIAPTGDKPLTFFWKKRQKWVRTHNPVQVRSRPIIKETIRDIAFKKFNRRFKLVRGN